MKYILNIIKQSVFLAC